MGKQNTVFLPVLPFIWSTSHLNDSKMIASIRSRSQGQYGRHDDDKGCVTANCIIIDHFSAFKSGLVAPFLYAA